MTCRDGYPIAVLLLLLTLSACGPFGPTESTPVYWPEAGIPALGGETPEYWDLHWLPGDGTHSHRTVDGQSRPVLTLLREYPAVVVAYPRDSSLPDSFFLKPAGCVLPSAGASNARVCLTWEDGFAALKVMELAKAGVSPLSINVGRFVDAVRTRSEGRPWDMDERRLWGDLLAGEIWIYSFKLLPDHQVNIPMSPGLWFGEYGLSPGLIVASGAWEGPLVQGIHRFFHQETGEIAIVDIDADGRVTQMTYR